MSDRSLRIPFALATSARFASRALADVARVSVGRDSLEGMAADAILRAPNRGRHVISASSPASAADLRVDVGSPKVTLAITIVDRGTSPSKSVFVLHGIRDSKESMRGWGELLASAGFRAILVDLRGHGESTGDTLSYGVRESQDLRELLDALLARGVCVGPAGVAGFSYGASVALQWAGLDPRISRVASIAPFSSLSAVLSGYLPIPLAPEFLRRVETLVGERGGFDTTLASPERAIRTTSAPVLLIHGKADERIPPSHSTRILEARPADTEIVLVERANHRGVVTSSRTELARRLPAWFAR